MSKSSHNLKPVVKTSSSITKPPPAFDSSDSDGDGPVEPLTSNENMASWRQRFGQLSSLLETSSRALVSWAQKLSSAGADMVSLLDGVPRAEATYLQFQKKHVRISVLLLFLLVVITALASAPYFSSKDLFLEKILKDEGTHIYLNFKVLCCMRICFIFVCLYHRCCNASLQMEPTQLPYCKCVAVSF